MPEQPSANVTLRDVRRWVSSGFWKLWKKLPLSARNRQQVLDTLFGYLPFLFFWTATYQNWKKDQARRRAQLARIAQQPLEETGARKRYVELSALPRPNALLARAVAFYLPQFHPIPENNQWWGEGFTEWTNVRRARPQFQGHNQPRRPAELGYYDLLANPEIQRRQAALAHQYGLEGFCFYFYWFAGKRLLEAPIEAFASNDQISLPFCLCWANETWSRRWDGQEDHILFAQQHSPEDDLAFIEYLSRYLKSPRYLRIGGKPLVIVYRPDLLPEPRATAARWRKWCREAGIGEIHLAYTLSFAVGTPEEYGFDTAIEFPPNNMGLAAQDGRVQPTADEFDCRIYDLAPLWERAEPYDRPAYPIFRGVTPQWDNTARRLNRAAVMLDGGPAAYQHWLRNAALDAIAAFRNPDERLVFINAWNEWAEGAYLEPDQQRGYAWLEATRRALTRADHPVLEPASLVPTEPMTEEVPPQKIIVVVHDLHPHGAQLHSLYMAATCKEKFGCEIITVACGDGPLRQRFEQYGHVIVLPKQTTSSREAAKAAERLTAQGYRQAIFNSSAGGWLLPAFHAAGIESVGLVHELPEIIRAMGLEENLDHFDRLARSVVFASDTVRQRTAEEILKRPWANATLLPQGLYKTESVLDPAEKEDARTELCGRLHLPGDARFVIAVGYGDHRKAPDIFCRWAIETARRDARLHFIWIGNLSADMTSLCDQILVEAGEVAGNVHFLGHQSDTSLYYRAASAYALSSREDPYPSTVLEALACGTPALIVAETTGLQAIETSAAIHVLPTGDPALFAAALTALLANNDTWADASAAGIRLIQEGYGFTSFAVDLLRLAGGFQPRISVIVPNYNYAHFLPHRIATLLNQELPVWEIIFLDDASDDDSLNVARQLLKDCGIRYRIVPNTENSGSVFAQWKKGVDLAQGDIVWIAEADDWAAAAFTRVAAQAFHDPEVVLSYTQSNQVSQTSDILCPHYLDYVADIDSVRWRAPFLNEGPAELNDGFSVKNTVPNVSGALFRRAALAATLAQHINEIASYRVAGDWCAYAHLARLGKIAFDPRPLNYHRRHTGSVTISRFTQAEWDEIARMQARVRELAEVSPENTARAAAYLEDLRKRLG